MRSKADWFFMKEGQWRAEYGALRDIVQACKLTEELKWGCPCYTHNGKNIVLIHGFKEYCALLFMQGALLKDPEKILVQQTSNVQAARQIRFTSLEKIIQLAPTIKAYIKEAVANEAAGKKVPLKKANEYPAPAEFEQVLTQKPAVRKAFYALTPGRQKAYLFYFGAAKQAATRTARIEKYLQKILDGKGLED